MKGAVEVVMLEFIRAWWAKTSLRARTGWKYLAVGVVLLVVMRVLQFVPSGVLLTIGIFAVGLTTIGVALIIWGSADVDDLRSFKS